MTQLAKKFCWICHVVLPLFFSPVLLADVSLPHLVSDHMVLQRDNELPLWGWADNNEPVTVFLDNKIIAKTYGKAGKWQVKLAPHKAGGPHTLKVEGNNRIVIKDIYFGDVWVASGQSNMELKMYRVAEMFAQQQHENHPLIRQFTVPQIYNFKQPQIDTKGGSWQLATAQNIPNMSAIALFFAKNIQAHQKIPIGIINNALGGSPVEAWMSEEALQVYPEAISEAYKYRDDNYLQSIVKANSDNNQIWYRNLDKLDKGLHADIPWYSPTLDDSQWQTFSLPGYRNLTKGKPFNGVWWFRKTINLSATQAEQAKILRLGRIVDADYTYINGVQVGNTTYQYPPRRYNIPAGLLREGENQITIRVIANSGRSGFLLDKPYWLGTDNKHILLTGNWKVKTAGTTEAPEPYVFVRWKPMGLFNGLTAPVTQFPVKGVIWYQGESNVGNWSDYSEKFQTMIKDWRKHWGQSQLPFIYVQLANFLERKTQPQESNWAQLRDQQTRSLALENTAMAVAIDTGEWNDIHPLDKKTVADRLALAARNMVYGEDVLYQGPMIRSANLVDSKVVLQFDHIGDGLHLSDSNANAFALAGDDGHFFWAKPTLVGNRIYLAYPGSDKPTQVRYAWADNPNSILYNSENLPAVPFSIAIED